MDPKLLISYFICKYNFHFIYPHSKINLEDDAGRSGLACVTHWRSLFNQQVEELNHTGKNLSGKNVLQKEEKVYGACFLKDSSKPVLFDKYNLAILL